MRDTLSCDQRSAAGEAAAALADRPALAHGTRRRDWPFRGHQSAAPCVGASVPLFLSRALGEQRCAQTRRLAGSARRLSAPAIPGADGVAPNRQSGKRQREKDVAPWSLRKRRVRRAGIARAGIARASCTTSRERTYSATEMKAMCIPGSGEVCAVMPIRCDHAA